MPPRKHDQHKRGSAQSWQEPRHRRSSVVVDSIPTVSRSRTAGSIVLADKSGIPCQSLLVRRTVYKLARISLENERNEIQKAVGPGGKLSIKISMKRIAIHIRSAVRFVHLQQKFIQSLYDNKAEKERERVMRAKLETLTEEIQESVAEVFDETKVNLEDSTLVINAQNVATQLTQLSAATTWFKCGDELNKAIHHNIVGIMENIKKYMDLLSTLSQTSSNSETLLTSLGHSFSMGADAMRELVAGFYTSFSRIQKVLTAIEGEGDECCAKGQRRASAMKVLGLLDSMQKSLDVIVKSEDIATMVRGKEQEEDFAGYSSERSRTSERSRKCRSESEMPIQNPDVEDSEGQAEQRISKQNAIASKSSPSNTSPNATHVNAETNIVVSSVSAPLEKDRFTSSENRKSQIKANIAMSIGNSNFNDNSIDIPNLKENLGSEKEQPAQWHSEVSMGKESVYELLSSIPSEFDSSDGGSAFTDVDTNPDDILPEDAEHAVSSPDDADHAGSNSLVSNQPSGETSFVTKVVSDLSAQSLPTQSLIMTSSDSSLSLNTRLRRLGNESISSSLAREDSGWTKLDMSRQNNEVVTCRLSLNKDIDHASNELVSRNARRLSLSKDIDSGSSELAGGSVSQEDLKLGSPEPTVTSTSRRRSSARASNCSIQETHQSENPLDCFSYLQAVDPYPLDLPEMEDLDASFEYHISSRPQDLDIALILQRRRERETIDFAWMEHDFELVKDDRSNIVATERRRFRFSDLGYSSMMENTTCTQSLMNTLRLHESSSRPQQGLHQDFHAHHSLLGNESSRSRIDDRPARMRLISGGASFRQLDPGYSRSPRSFTTGAKRFSSHWQPSQTVVHLKSSAR